MRKIYLLCLLCAICVYAVAQKLPDVQNTSLKVPSPIKIDGKLTEWNNAFQAENKRTNLFYSLANDETNIYLVIKSANNDATTKILAGGITFSINTSGKKREENAFALTYPIIAKGNFRGRGRSRDEVSAAQRDSINFVARKAQLLTFKEIKLNGYSAIPDSLISIYNEYGIKVGNQVELAGNYSFELAIPLKYLNLTADGVKEIAYQIKLNGMTAGFGGGGSFRGSVQVRGIESGGFSRGNSNNNADLMNPTDFWGKYILVKN
jgi:hypothetical protein